MNYWVLFGLVALVSWLVQQLFQSKFKKYSKVPLPSGLTGADVARKMLSDNGIKDVAVRCTDGMLTDHYNPVDKTVNLSSAVYNSCSVAAAAVAAHECGHAVQHACGYAPLRLRSALVPAVNFSAKYVSWVLLAGMLLLNWFPQLLLAGIVLFAVTTLFSFVTLPVEINASRRAVAWLEYANIAVYETRDEAKDALRAAAYTYVVAALSSLATLFYYIMVYTNRRD